MDAANYRVAEAAEQKRLDEWTNDSQVGQVTKDLGLSRHLTEKAVQAGDVRLAQSLLLTTNRLARTHSKATMQENQTLHKTVVLDIVAQVLQIIQEELDGVVGIEDRLERAAVRIGVVVETAENTPGMIVSEHGE